MIFSCRIAAMVRASRKKRVTYSGCDENSGGKTFNATGRSSVPCTARYTLPIPPCPSLERMRKLAICGGIESLMQLPGNERGIINKPLSQSTKSKKYTSGGPPQIVPNLGWVRNAQETLPYSL